MREAGVTAFVLRRGLEERMFSAAWAALCVGIGAAGLAMHAAVAADTHDAPLWGAAIGAAAGLAAAALAWRSMPDAHWRLEVHANKWALATVAEPSDVREGRVDAMMDLGGWLLLRFREAGSRRDTWLSASAPRLGSGWHPLRAALFRPDGAAGAAVRRA